MPATKEKYSPKMRTALAELEGAKTHHTRNFRRSVRNWQMYLAHDPELGHGQWPEEVVAYMLEHRRQLIQHNFTAPIIDTIAGGLMQLELDPEYYPINEKANSLTKAITKAMYGDKELMDWNTAKLEMARAGLIHQGVLKLYISREYDDLGNVGLHYCLPSSVTTDPYWRSLESKHMKKLWWETWHTAAELADIYPDKTDLFREEMELSRRSGDRYGSPQGAVPYARSEDMWGSQHRLIRMYYMKREKRKYEVAVIGDDIVRLPDIAEAEAKIAFLNANHPDWDPMAVFEESETVSMCHLKVACPTLCKEDFVADDYCDIQIGRLPFLVWSAGRVNGEPKSIVDSCKDAQESINYLSSMAQYKMQIEGGGGSQFIDPSQFESEEEAQSYIENRNDPSQTFKVLPGALRNGSPAVPTQKAAFPSEIYQALNHIIQTVLPNTSYTTPTSKGMTEDAGQSGRLFELLKIQSDQQVYTLHYGWRAFHNELYEAYLMLATDMYSNEDVERTFTYNHGKECLTLNERITLPDGRKAIRNDVKQLKRIRHKVVVGEQNASPTEKASRLNAYGKFISSLGQSLPIMSTVLAAKAAPMMDGLDDETIEELQALSEVETELKVQEARTALAEMKVREINAQSQAKQLAAQSQQPQQQAQPMPPQGPAESVEQAPVPSPEVVQQAMRAEPELTPQMAPIGQGGQYV